MSDERKGGFWSSLPGILTGLAAAITAGTGLYLAMQRHEGAGIDASSVSREPHAVSQSQLPAKEIETLALSPPFTREQPTVVTPSPAAIPSEARGVLFHSIVASTRSRDEAIARATALQASGYPSEVILSASGTYGITLGGYPNRQLAVAAIKHARQRGDAPADAYVLPPERWKATVFQ